MGKKLKYLGVCLGTTSALIYGGAFLMGKNDQINFLVGGLIRGSRCGMAGLTVARKYLKVKFLKDLNINY